MKLLLVAHEIPYPPIHGGRMDTWTRIVALSRLEVPIHLVTWTDESVTNESLSLLNEYVHSVELHSRNRAPYRALHPKYPTSLVSRILPRAEYAAELKRVRCICPDVVFLDGLVGSVLAESLAKDLGVPLVYRSHNVEHQYLMDQAQAASVSFRKAKLFANAWRTKRVEREIRNTSVLTYDISAEDRDAWRKDGTTAQSKVLNYFLHPDRDLGPVDSNLHQDIDSLYVGNLNTPNNVFGLTWFAREVAPLLKGLRIVIAGSGPTPEMRRVLQEAKVEFIADPKEVRPLYERARVMTNPVWHSSGVNIKMVELLATGKPVVSTSAGTRGLKEPVLEFVKVANQPSAFAKAVLESLSKGASSEQQEAVVEEFGWENVVTLLEDLRQVVAAPSRLA